MSNKITATFKKRRFQDSGGSMSPDYYVYEFNNVIGGEHGNLLERWIKETKLMRAVKFVVGKEYQITFNREFNLAEWVNMPYPVEVAWDNGKVYMKGGNSIIEVDANGNETNLSVPSNKLYRTNNYETAALNKFGKGILTEDLLLKMNDRGVFFRVHHYDPQDKRKSMVYSYGQTSAEHGNNVLIQKETQKEIDYDLEWIKKRYLNAEIEKYFTIKTELLQPKKNKK